ncbi:beta-1,6-N-acetylglucosaminyltransferase [Aquimarina aggregata]|uniref:beta-1,6-N-acetylglucosaminyltransferase n=1 Tax=Aquimarina aggregata TaxID=1642818 RepID=UPI0008339249|nr:beta-1,6-N-acetylglucosaminyltransferase [Aquimarina aggregata]
MTQELGIPKKQSFDFNTQRKKIKIAYFILVKHFPKQFKRLFKAIHHPENHYLILINQKTDINTIRDIKTFLEDYSNAYFLKSTTIDRGKYNRIQSQLNGMKYLLNRCLKWDFFINLSGQDFPLKSQDFILDFLNRNKSKNFIKIVSQVRVRPDTLSRVENYFQEIDVGFLGVPYKRSFMKNVTSYVGGQWMILTRSCCEFICHSPEVKKFEDFYDKILIANESFFQTILMNTSFKETIINDDKRAVMWLADGDVNVKPKTFTGLDIDFLMQEENFFAQKFDEGVDESILEILEEILKTDEIKNDAKSISLNLIPKPDVSTEINVLLDPRTIINPPTQITRQLLNGNKKNG